MQTASIYKSDTYKNSLLPNGGKEFLYTTNYQQVTDSTSHHTSSTLSLVYRGRYPLHPSDLPRFSWYTVADTHFTCRIFHAFPVKPWMVLVRTILFTFLSSPNDLTSPTFPLLSCRDARFFEVFFASCPMWCGIAPLSCRDAKFCYVFPASCPVLCGVCSFPYRDAKFFAVFSASCPFVVRDCVLVLP